MKTMSKNLFTGLMTRKGTATATVHARNYIFQKSFKARQVLMAKAKTNGAPEPETLEDQTPNQTQPESACPEMKTTGATALPLAENTRKTVSLKESFSDQRERWMARTKESQRKAMLAAKESPSKATRNKWSTPGKYDWQQQL
ncbi:uncharacterized protein LOC108157661 [Drosophila miranda]|uniref:uncharacterized protein LOC108157661 n=1 Tax=Drosophila miranda TaxID=7229 RepID=UPI00143F7E3D|nr:uncharacterized protein LOC108157661 [Drosophila miranda]